MCLLIVIISLFQNWVYLEQRVQRLAVQDKIRKATQIPEMPDSPVVSLEEKREQTGVIQILLLANSFYQFFDDNITISPGKTCTFYSDDRSLFNSSDVIIIKGSHLSDPALIPHYRPPGQLRIYYEVESPLNTFPDRYGENWNNFNYTMTYSHTSDIYLPLGSCVPRKEEYAKVELEIKHIVQSKTRQVLWMVSHCKSRSLRESYVRKLTKYVPIDVYGICGSEEECPKGAFCVDFFRQYKFYLAFENSFCDEYITEKLWKCLNLSVIPVVYGPSSSYLRQVLPAHSYIEAASFAHPYELAAYLWKVSGNLSLYSSYFSWRHNYTCSLPDVLRFEATKRTCQFVYDHQSTSRTVDVLEYLARENASCQTTANLHLKKMGIKYPSKKAFSKDDIVHR